MYYPVVFSFDGEGYQMYAPDITGVHAYSQSDNLDDAIKQVQFVMSEMLTDNYSDAMPIASTVQDVQKTELHEEGDFVMPVNATYCIGKNIRVNLSMPDYVLHLIDDDAKRAGVSRSAYVINKVLS